MTTLIFVRHGQSVSNLEYRFTGQGDTPLTDLGRLQAERTAAYLASYPIDVIYSSDLSRAYDTARPTAQYHGLEIISDPAFREINAGDWEGHTYEELHALFEKDYETWRQDVGRAHPQNGERVTDLAARIYAATERVLAEHRGKCVAIFTHATPVRMMGCKWFGYAAEDAAKLPFCGNASVSIVEYEEDGTCRLICYGYDRHQGDAATELPKNLV